jgi:ABC-2 type transport system ATP-binding protein
MGLAIRAEDLRKRYGDTTALDGVDLSVPSGTVCGLLGPNGAGKTTVVRILATLLRPDGGHAAVAGVSVADRPDEVRRRIGLVGQNTALDELLSGEQNLVMFGRLYHLGATRARVRAEELLIQFGLADTGAKLVKEYSGGMRRRLDLAASLILRPAVLFMDEPTTGLDPRGRNEVWAAIRNLVATGTSVLLTTQYLDEADQLADQICVIDSGKVIADGSPAQLKAAIGADHLDVVVRDEAALPTVVAALAVVGAGEPHCDRDARRVSVAVAEPMTALTTVVRDLHDAGIAVEDIGLRRPTLDEVFLRLTSSAEEVSAKREERAAGGAQPRARGASEASPAVASQGGTAA